MTAAQYISLKVEPDIADALQAIADKGQLNINEAAARVLQRAIEGMPRRLMISVADYKPQHIPVMIDPHEDGIKKQFRCVVCGLPWLGYYGGVKLITYGTYDMNQNMIDGEESDWFSKTGTPDETICQGRVLLTRPDGGVVKRRCGTVYYRIGV